DNIKENSVFSIHHYKMKVIFFLTFSLSLLVLKVNSNSTKLAIFSPVNNETCSKLAYKILNFIFNELPFAMDKQTYEMTIASISFIIDFDLLKDHEELSEAVCTILNAKTLFEMCQGIRKYFIGSKSVIELSFMFERQHAAFEQYLATNYYLKHVRELKDFFKYFSEYFVGKNPFNMAGSDEEIDKLVSGMSPIEDDEDVVNVASGGKPLREEDEKIARLVNAMSSKHGSDWLYNLHESHIFSYLFQTNNQLEDNERIRYIARAIIEKCPKNLSISRQSLENFIIAAYSVLENRADINKVVEAYEHGFEIAEYFSKADIFNRPKCNNVGTVEKIITFLTEHKNEVLKLLPEIKELRVELERPTSGLKLVVCNIINSKDLTEFNNRIAMYTFTPKLTIEKYESLVASLLLLPSEFYYKSIEIGKDFLLKNGLFNNSPSNLIKIGQQLTDIYNDLENIGLVNLIKQLQKTCNSTKYKI
ncbi:DgyrCDS14669, partial [Dimorphilus gyrociliatus]